MFFLSTVVWEYFHLDLQKNHSSSFQSETSEGTHRSWQFQDLFDQGTLHRLHRNRRRLKQRSLLAPQYTRALSSPYRLTVLKVYRGWELKLIQYLISLFLAI